MKLEMSEAGGPSDGLDLDEIGVSEHPDEGDQGRNTTGDGPHLLDIDLPGTGGENHTQSVGTGRDGRQGVLDSDDATELDAHEGRRTFLLKYRTSGPEPKRLGNIEANDHRDAPNMCQPMTATIGNLWPDPLVVQDHGA